MKGLYSISTTIPLNADGNPSEKPGATIEETLTTSALLNRFFGSRFVVEENGNVRKLQPNETAEFPFVGTINFHPVTSCAPLLRLVFITQLAELLPEQAKEHQMCFHLQGIGIESGRKYSFVFENDTIRVSL